ncbi:hypothetical protein BKA67DRAFT_570265 [Truncatella angustata]|uniref:Uncharacterized protein n=1 Tax=Truncatella angustata TaxID=152316 RepID=A0A9P8UK30_9PEZI|nr:uncharacterized protein BKA67DRAFT_570265 [Truncatella angustata]KAH6653556.1 hypothetical protein BKA67DRAFT_570265 [Truncatella angustata]
MASEVGFLDMPETGVVQNRAQSRREANWVACHYRTLTRPIRSLYALLLVRPQMGLHCWLGHSSRPGSESCFGSDHFWVSRFSTASTDEEVVTRLQPSTGATVSDQHYARLGGTALIRILYCMYVHACFELCLRICLPFLSRVGFVALIRRNQVQR